MLSLESTSSRMSNLARQDCIWPLLFARRISRIEHTHTNPVPAQRFVQAPKSPHRSSVLLTASLDAPLAVNLFLLRL